MTVHHYSSPVQLAWTPHRALILLGILGPIASISAVELASWNRTVREMVEFLPVPAGARAPMPVVHNLPSWMPFTSFTIGNHIFLSEHLASSGFSDAEIKAIIGHELWHVFRRDTWRQLGFLGFYAVLFLLGYRATEQTAWWRTLPQKTRYAFTGLAAYLTYAIFHKYSVRPMELAAERASAHVLGNRNALITMLSASQAAGEADQWSLGKLLFKLIAPFQPTDEEFLAALGTSVNNTSFQSRNSSRTSSGANTAIIAVTIVALAGIYSIHSSN